MSCPSPVSRAERSHGRTRALNVNGGNTKHATSRPSHNAGLSRVLVRASIGNGAARMQLTQTKRLKRLLYSNACRYLKDRRYFVQRAAGAGWRAHRSSRPRDGLPRGKRGLGRVRRPARRLVRRAETIGVAQERATRYAVNV